MNSFFLGVKPEEVLKEVKEDELSDKIEDLNITPQKLIEEEDVPPLNILILIVGTQGDVQPFVAFALELKRKGHKIRFATHYKFKKFVEDKELDFYPLKGDPEALIGFMVKHPDMLTFDPSEIEFNHELMEEIYFSTWQAATGKRYRPEVIISNPPVHVHCHLAEKLQVPLFIAFTMPSNPTTEYKHPFVPPAIASKVSNKISYELVERMIWLGLSVQQNRFRKHLGLSILVNGANYPDKLRVPHIYCMSPHLVPKPSDWGNNIDVVGFWFLESTSAYNPPKDLADFLSNGPPPLYVGFGSIVVENPAKLSEDVIGAIKDSGLRAIVSRGWAKLGEGMDLPDTIKLIDACPHDWLFPRCSAVCHHGGAGTTAIGLKCGLPTVIVPFFGNQPFWGSCVYRMGVGPQPIPIKELTREALKNAFLACQNQTMIDKAKELGKKLTEEKGLENGYKAFIQKLPVSKKRWTEEVYESERFAILVGWSSSLLVPHVDYPHYSDKTGHFSLKLEDFILPYGWEWISNWEPVVNEFTDSEGWTYNTHFPQDKKQSAHWSKEKSHYHVVRIRKLIKIREWKGTDLTDVRSMTHTRNSNSGVENLIDTSLATIFGGISKSYEEVILYIELIEGMELIHHADSHFNSFIEIKILNTQKNKEKAQKFHSQVKPGASPKWNQASWYEVLPYDKLQLTLCKKSNLLDKIKPHELASFQIEMKEVLEEIKKSSTKSIEKWYEFSKQHGKIHLKLFI